MSSRFTIPSTDPEWLLEEDAFLDIVLVNPYRKWKRIVGMVPPDLLVLPPSASPPLPPSPPGEGEDADADADSDDEDLATLLGMALAQRKTMQRLLAEDHPDPVAVQVEVTLRLERDIERNARKHGQDGAFWRAVSNNAPEHPFVRQYLSVILHTERCSSARRAGSPRIMRVRGFSPLPPILALPPSQKWITGGVFSSLFSSSCLFSPSHAKQQAQRGSSSTTATARRRLRRRAETF
jgi:hypothetical protein